MNQHWMRGRQQSRAFENADVQNAISRAATMERAEEARKKYMKKLREDAFVEIAKGYVTPPPKPDKAEK